MIREPDRAEFVRLSAIRARRAKGCTGRHGRRVRIHGVSLGFPHQTGNGENQSWENSLIWRAGTTALQRSPLPQGSHGRLEIRRPGCLER